MTLHRRLLPISAAAVGVALMGFSVDGMADLEHNLQLAATKPPGQARPDAGAQSQDRDCKRFKREYEYSRL